MKRLIALSLFALTVVLPAVAWAQTPASVVPKEGQRQFGYRNRAFKTPIRAGVYDASGAPVAGVTVTFTTPASGPSGSLEGSGLEFTAVTDSAGLTPPVVVTANATAGRFSVLATVDGVQAAARFTLTNYAGGGSGKWSGSNTSPMTYGYGHLTGSCYWSNNCSSVNWSSSMTSGDFNNDGFLDLVAYNDGYRELSFRAGNGGGFGGPVNTVIPAPGNTVWDIAAGDFNNDNKLDVAFINGGGGIRLMYGIGTGAFTAGPLVAVSNLHAYNFIATGDLNRDGLIDIVSSGAAPLIATGAGTFVPAAGNGGPGAEVLLGDLNADGCLDMISAGGYDGVLVERGKCDGTFHAYEFYRTGVGPDRIALGDFNGDGLVDITANTQPNPDPWHGGASVVILQNTGATSGALFAAPRTVYNFPVKTLHAGIAAADLNRDGLDDIIAVADSVDIFYGPSPGGAWLIARGNGGFDNLGSTMAFLQPNEVVVDDFNQDGKPDVAMNSYGQNSPNFPSGITVYNNGGGVTGSIAPTQGTPQNISIGTTGFNLWAKVKDVNGNNLPDAPVLVVAPTSGPTATLFDQSLLYARTNGTGDIGLTPVANNQLGPYQVTVSTPTGPGESLTATFYLTNVPPPPTAVNDGPYTTAEDTPLVVGAPGLLANDYDSDGASLTAFVLNPLPTKGVVQINTDGSFVYTPNKDANGSDTFRYRAYDGTTYSQQVIAVTVNITPVNDPPTATAKAYSVNEDASLSVPAAGLLAGVTDPEGGAFTAAVAQQPSNGTVTVSANGSFVYVPNANFHGVDTFSYTARDATNLESAPAPVTITVNNVFDPPVANADAYAAQEDLVLTVGGAAGVLANDTYNTGAQVSVLMQAQHGVVTMAADGSFVYAPAQDYSGPDSFSYLVSEGEGSVSSTVSLTVASINDAPVSSVDSFSTIAGAPLSVGAPGVLANDSDVDADALTAQIATPPSQGTVSLGPDGSLLYSPGLNVAGVDTFTYTVSDGVATSTSTVTVTVGQAATITTLAVADSSVALGEAVTLTASVGILAPGSGSLAGLVTFMNGNAVLATAPIANGSASFTTSTLPAGSYAISAIYGGEPAFVASSSAIVALEVVANTPTGSDVVATPVDEATGASPITLEFDEVTAPGTSTLTITPTGPHAPSGFKFGTPPVYYNLETTATFTGQVTVCFSYDDTNVRNERNLRLFHYENNAWTNITTGVDVDANKVCGTTSHFSPFALGEPNDAPVLSNVTAVVDTSAPRLTVTTSASVSDADVDDVHAAVWEWGDGTTTPAAIVGSAVSGAHTYAAAGTYTVKLTLHDGATTVSATTVVVTGNVDTTAPAIMLGVSPREIGPPNGKLVPVAISGSVMDAGGVQSAGYAVTDEYGQVQPSGALTLGANGGFSVTVMVPAARNGSDKDGRVFTIVITATDAAGNTAQSSSTAVVLHDQRKK